VGFMRTEQKVNIRRAERSRKLTSGEQHGKISRTREDEDKARRAVFYHRGEI